MPDHSVTDLSVAGANSQLFELLYRRLPASLVLDFFDAANSWELQHSMAHRFAGMAELIEDAVARTPALAERGKEIAYQCAEFLFRSNATLLALVTQLDGHDEPALAVRWEGRDTLDRLVDAGRPIVVMAPHVAYFYAIPFLLADRVGASAVLGNVVARDALSPVFPAIAPRLQPQIRYIEVPSPTSARTAFSALQRSVPLVVFPEVTQGATGNVGSAVADLLGRQVWVPTTIARFARMARAEILPMLVTPTGDREVTVAVGEPLPRPPDRSADAAVSLAVFDRLEEVVLAQPHLWWGWPMLDTMMAVPADGPAAP